MSTNPPLAVRRSITWAVSAVALVTLMGCSIDPLGDALEKGAQKVAEEAAEKAIESAAGGDVNIDTDSGKISVEGENGEEFEMSVGEEVELPSSFPSDIPLPEGTLRTAVSIQGTFNLQYTVSNEDVAKSLVDTVKGSGFEVVSESDLGQIWRTSMTGDAYKVIVGFIADDAEPMLTYNILPNEEQNS